MNIPKTNLKISIGPTVIPIQDRFTLICGKIKKNLLTKYKNESFLAISENLNIVPLEKFVKILQEESKENIKLVNSLKILEYIHEYHKTVSKNLSISSQYNEIIQNLILILRYNYLLSQRETLLKELEISEYYKKSSNLKATTDLLDKLTKSLTNNKKKLKFLEEDYFQRKNQVDQIKSRINEYNLQIQELTEQKKYYFNQINKITREMAEDIPEINKEFLNVKNSNNNLTNAEKIKNFQKKAKESQFKINKIKSKKSQTQLKLDDLNPIFETYQKDYQKVLEIIKNEENRIIDLQTELKKKIGDEGNLVSQDLDLIDLKLLRASQEIKNDIDKANSELNRISIPKNYFNPQKANDLSLIIQHLNELDETTKNHEPDIIITINEKEIINCIEKFTTLEDSISQIESMINKFLPEINLLTQFKFIISDDNNHFFIDIKFIRSDKTIKVEFDELTTPEKIYFIIVFYISIKLQTKSKNIIFSNVSVSSQYNKAGSIFRTIRKILPIFKIDDDLSRFNLIFIISNLELKKEIKNLNIKTIQES